MRRALSYLKEDHRSDRTACPLTVRRQNANSTGAVNGIETEMQRLQISNNIIKEEDDDEENLLEAAIKLAAAEREELEAAAKNDEVNNSEECDHGLISYCRNPICRAFMKSFGNMYKTASESENSFECAYEATKTTYAEVWSDPDKLRWLASFYLAHGTKKILRGEYDGSLGSAGLAFFFEQSAAIAMHANDTQTSCDWGIFRALCDWGKLFELVSADRHTLVSFFRKRIPCNCLDEKLKEVKSITKMGFCHNSKCNLPPGKKTARGKMLSCTRCRSANYCSRECQVAHWPLHKEFCVFTARRLEAQKSGLYCRKVTDANLEHCKSAAELYF